jgi:hypothetical protein
MVAVLLTELQSTLKISHISIVTKRHTADINTIYKHHPVLGVYDIKIQTLYLAAYTITCD